MSTDKRELARQFLTRRGIVGDFTLPAQAEHVTLEALTELLTDFAASLVEHATAAQKCIRHFTPNCQICSAINESLAPAPVPAETTAPPDVSLQMLLDSGINAFAVKLVAESFTRKKDFAEWNTSIEFVLDGVRMTFQRHAAPGSPSEATAPKVAH